MSKAHIPASLRREVRERAGDRCEYCRAPESHSFNQHWIDHVVAEKHGGETTSDNLALACVRCNQHKGTDLTSIDPATGRIVRLFNPRTDLWPDHFQFLGAVIEPRTAEGRTTARLLRLNQPSRIQEREIMIAAGLIPST